jgi:excisionase family DNA binding protein
VDDTINNDWMTVEEAAVLTGFSVHTIRKYAQQRRIPFYQRTKGAPLLFRREELLAWAEPKPVTPHCTA